MADLATSVGTEVCLSAAGERSLNIRLHLPRLSGPLVISQLYPSCQSHRGSKVVSGTFKSIINNSLGVNVLFFLSFSFYFELQNVIYVSSPEWTRPLNRSLFATPAGGISSESKSLKNKKNKEKIRKAGGVILK